MRLASRVSSHLSREGSFCAGGRETASIIPQTSGRGEEGRGTLFYAFGEGGEKGRRQRCCVHFAGRGGEAITFRNYRSRLKVSLWGAARDAISSSFGKWEGIVDGQKKLFRGKRSKRGEEKKGLHGGRKSPLHCHRCSVVGRRENEKKGGKFQSWKTFLNRRGGG